MGESAWKRCHGGIRFISFQCDESSERGRQGFGRPTEKGPRACGRFSEGHEVQGCKGIHKRMRRQSSPAEEGTGSMFKATRPVGTKAPRRHAVGTVGTTWRYKSN